MNFLHPTFLLVGAVAAALVVLAAFLVARARRRTVARFASAGLTLRRVDTASRPRRAFKTALLALGVALAGVALAQPRWGWQWRESRRQGVDLLFAVDTSRSMLAADVRPSRLARAKLAVHDLVARFDGDRAGLIAFAGEAFLQAPMTLDRDAFGRALDALDTEVIPRPGTDVAAAIREARAAFGATDHERILVLLTDGEALEGDAVGEAEAAAREGVRIYAVGIGGADGATIPVRAADGSETLLRGPDGEVVRSRLDEGTLRRIAAATGGDYEPFGADGLGLRRLYERRLSTLPRHAIAERRQRAWFERFQWPLGLAAALLALEAIVGDRRRERAVKRQARAAAPRMVAAMGAAAMVVALAASPAFAEAGRDTVRTYNSGVTAYRGGNFAAARAGFEGALHTGDLGLQQQAYYDLGNARFRAGEATATSDRAATHSAWEASVRAYEAALRLRRGDADAQHNLDLVRRRLAALDHEQESPQQQPQNGQQGQHGQQGQQSGSHGQQSGSQGQQAGSQGQQGQQANSQGQQGGQQGGQHGQPGEHGNEPGTQSGQASTQAGQPSTPSGQASTQAGQPSTPSGQASTQAGQPSTPSGQPSTQAGQASAQPNQPGAQAGQPRRTTQSARRAGRTGDGGGRGDADRAARRA